MSYLGSGSATDDRATAYRTLPEKGKLIAPKIIEACSSASNDQGLREHALALAANLKLDGTFAAAKTALADTTFARSHAALKTQPEVILLTR